MWEESKYSPTDFWTLFWMEVRGELHSSAVPTELEAESSPHSQSWPFGAASIPNPDLASRSLVICRNFKFKICLVYDQV